MIIVLPICKKDTAAALRNLAWCKELDPNPQQFTCIVSYEAGLSDAAAVIQSARLCFSDVQTNIYTPYRGKPQWPYPQNYAFRATAAFMAKRPGLEPWLWWEQDAVPLCASWLSILADGYASCSAMFMGAIGASEKDEADHINGVAVYPSDACRRVAALIANSRLPFDVAGGKRVMAHAHITDLIQHVWSWDGPTGNAPIFPDAESLSRIEPDAVLFHRCKDDSLVRQLRQSGRPKSVGMHLEKPIQIIQLQQNPVTEGPPCIIMLGGLGDVLIALCIAYHYWQLHKTPVPFVTADKYKPVLKGCSYVNPVGIEGKDWPGYTEAMAWAKTQFKKVLPLHVGEPEIVKNPQMTRFCHEQYLHAEVPGRYGEFPLVFDKRNPAREADLVAGVKKDKPLLLYNITGRSSPFPFGPKLVDLLAKEWGDELDLVDTSSLNLSHYQDMLGLLDQSIGLITIDTSTLHLMAASKTPYIALLQDTKTPWWSSVPRGNCALQLGYTKVPSSISTIHKTIAGMLEKGASQAARPVAVDSRAMIVTLACNGMEEVWKVASETWAPWNKLKGHTFSIQTKSPIPEKHPSWNKVALVLKELEWFDVVWWVDADITVARPDSTLPSSRADLAFSTDWNGLCACMFRARATPWTKAFLNASLTLGDVRDPNQFGKGLGCKWEQNTFKLLLREFPDAAKHVELFPRSLVTDQPMKPSNAAFYHFGGMTNAKRIEAMKKKHQHT